ncbi:FAD:protein FMN transferase [Ralstonia pickettii]|uniref:FAD:protein FMN transferase n=1 Tax=Ralstonia pickettii TaxID=329 RepID=UPI00046AEFEC|nr:FAD:protein FMN transferase [Ralstonia pickettii]
MIRRSKPLLGTFVEVRIDDVYPQDCAHLAETAIAAAFSVIEQAEALMSFQRSDSDLSRLHAASVGEAVRVHPWTMRVLREAQRMHERTGGVFDPTVARMLVAHKILPRPAGPTAEVDARIADVVTLGENRISKRRALWLDLGGIAKGFAVDMAILSLRRHNVRSGAVSAGGDLRVFGKHAQPIHVRSANAPGRLELLGRLTNGAVATSGHYFAESFGLPPGTESIRSQQILTEAPCAERTVTVIAPRCIWADALTKVAMLAGTTAPATVRALSSYHAHVVAS